MFPKRWSRASIVTRVLTGQSRNRGWIPPAGKRHFFSKALRRSQVSTQSHTQWVPVLCSFPGGQAVGVWVGLTTHLRVVLSSRMCGAILALSLHTFMPCTHKYKFYQNNTYQYLQIASQVKFPGKASTSQMWKMGTNGWCSEAKWQILPFIPDLRVFDLHVCGWTQFLILPGPQYMQ
jgi:hypothetical protein